MPVTAPTAATLRAARFPQPDPAFGQVWYAPTGEPRVFCCRVTGHDVHRTPLWRFVTEWGRQDDVEPDVVRRDWCYAATATEILDAMPIPELTSLHRGNRHLWVVESSGAPYTEPRFHANEHEAAATAWLSQQPAPTP